MDTRFHPSRRRLVEATVQLLHQHHVTDLAVLVGLTIPGSGKASKDEGVRDGSLGRSWETSLETSLLETSASENQWQPVETS